MLEVPEHPEVQVILEISPTDHIDVRNKHKKYKLKNVIPQHTDRLLFYLLVHNWSHVGQRNPTIKQTFTQK